MECVVQGLIPHPRKSQAVNTSPTAQAEASKPGGLGFYSMSYHRITESSRWEKPAEIVESNHSPSTAAFPGVTSMCFLNTSRDCDSITSLGNLFRGLTTLSAKKILQGFPESVSYLTGDPSCWRWISRHRTPVCVRRMQEFP